jgi:hypothetical protein
MCVRNLQRIMLIVALFILLLAITVEGDQDLGYSIELTRVGYLTLGPGFDYERGLSYTYRIGFPSAEEGRNLWLLIDLDGSKEWREAEATAGSTGWRCETKSRSDEGILPGTHTLMITVFEDESLPSLLGFPSYPPGYMGMGGEVEVPAEWKIRATDSMVFTVLSPGIPENRTDGIWVSSSPLGGEVYVAPATAARDSGGKLSLPRIMTDEYYRGAAPVFVQVPQGDYIVGVMIPVEEELEFARDGDFAGVVVTKRDEIEALGKGYEVTKKAGELATVIALFQLRGKPLNQAFLHLPESSCYDFDDAGMRRTLLREGFSSAVIEPVIPLLHKVGKIVIETSSKRTVVQITAGGWRMIVYTASS